MLSIPKSYAIIDPGTVMIHVKDASIAGRTVMTSFWLEYIAHQAISSSFHFRISLMKALDIIVNGNYIPKRQGLGQGQLALTGRSTTIT